MSSSGPPTFPIRYGKYELLEKIGEGGMAEVFRARLPGAAGFEKILVLKRILPHLAKKPDFVRMFVDEAKLAAKVHHQNVVQVFELGEVEGGELYMAMEHINGVDYRRLLVYARERSLRIPIWFVLHTIAEVLRGLTYAHELVDEEGNPLHVVHRDVTPGNIFISYQGEVKLADFGIAKAVGRVSETEAGQVKGNAPFMAPEAIYGRALDERADVFSAGVVLWASLALRLPFEGGSSYETAKLVCEAKREPPSRYNPLVSPELDQVALEALEIDRNRRIPSAREFQSRLLELLARTRPKLLPADVRHVVDVLTGRRPPDAQFSATDPRSLRPAGSTPEVQVIDVPQPEVPRELTADLSVAGPRTAPQVSPPPVHAYPGPQPLLPPMPGAKTPGAGPLGAYSIAPHAGVGLPPHPALPGPHTSGPLVPPIPQATLLPPLQSGGGAPVMGGPLRAPPVGHPVASPASSWPPMGLHAPAPAIVPGYAAPPPLQGPHDEMLGHLPDEPLEPVAQGSITGPIAIAPLYSRTPERTSLMARPPAPPPQAARVEARDPDSPFLRDVPLATMMDFMGEPAGPPVELQREVYRFYNDTNKFLVRFADGTVLTANGFDEVLSFCDPWGRRATAISIDNIAWMELPLFARLCGLDYLVADTSPPRNVTMVGALEDRSLASVFVQLARQRLTGRLVVMDKGVHRLARREVDVLNGAPVYVYADHPSLQFPHLFAQHRLVKKELVPELVIQVLKQRQSIEEIARRTAFVDLNPYRPVFMRDRLAELFTWRYGRFAFDTGREIRGTAPFAASLLRVLPDAMVRGFSSEELRRELEPMINVKLRRTESFDAALGEMALKDKQATAAKRLGQKTAIAKVVEKHPMEAQVILAMAKILLELEVLVPA